MVYSDVLEVLEKADSDGRHLEEKMQKLEEFQWTGKLESVNCCKTHSSWCNIFHGFVQLGTRTKILKMPGFCVFSIV